MLQQEKARVLRLMVTLMGRFMGQESILPTKMKNQCRSLVTMGAGAWHIEGGGGKSSQRTPRGGSCGQQNLTRQAPPPLGRRPPMISGSGREQ